MTFLNEYKKIDAEKLSMETGQYSVLLGNIHAYLVLSHGNRGLRTDANSLSDLVRDQSKELSLNICDSIRSLAEILDVLESGVFDYISACKGVTEKKVYEALQDVQSLRNVALKTLDKK